MPSAECLDQQPQMGGVRPMQRKLLRHNVLVLPQVSRWETVLQVARPVQERELQGFQFTVFVLLQALRHLKLLAV